MVSRRKRAAHGLYVGALALTGAMAVSGCAGSSGAATKGGSPVSDGQGGSQPQASPRSDGAALLYSPYTSEDPEASAQNPAFSPDGSRLVFTRFSNGYNSGPAELWIVDRDGGNAHRITPVEDQDNVSVPGAAWNAVRDEIVFASDRQESDDIWAIKPDGSGLRRITTHSTPPYWIEPVWSPDGQWIVFEAESDAPTELAQRGTIFKVRADGTDLTQLTKRDGQDYDDRLPNWSADGERILFQRRLPAWGDGDNWDVYVMDIDGDALVNVSNAAEYFNTDNSWSPDGRWIASSSVYPAEGQPLELPNIVAFFVPETGVEDDLPEPARLTFTQEHEDGAPSVSPDGRWLAFESHRTSDEESPTDLWIIETPGALWPSEATGSRASRGGP